MIKNILIVDDDERVLQTFTRNLELLEYHVFPASRGTEALRIFQEFHPDLTLADVRMPQMDGFALLSALRALDPQAEVILVTGHGDMETAIEALRAGASDFVLKPVEQTVLEATLHRAQARVRLKRALQAAEDARTWESHVNAVMAEMAEIMLSPASLEEISNVVLERAKALTGSRFGFVGYIDPHSGAMISSTLTRDIWEQCQVPDKSFIFKKFGGLWGWVLEHKQSVLVNDLTRDPRSTGTPPGHIPIERFLGVPALHGESLVGEIALANPPRDYEPRDRLAVQRLASLYALAVERRRTQAQLQASEARFRQLLEMAPDGIFNIDAQGNIVMVNVQAEKLFGYRRDEMIGRPIEMLLPAPFAHIHAQQRVDFLKQARARPMGAGRDLVAWRKDGTEFPVEVNLSPVELEEGMLVICTIRDISERRRVEEQLRLQGTALQAAANAIVITDRDGAIQWVNPAFTALTGYTAEEALGQNPRVLKSGCHPDDFYRELWDTILAGQIWHNELINRRKDGTLYTEEMTIAPVRDPRGEITHFIAIKQDVTARKQAEEALRRARDELELRVQERTAELAQANLQLQEVNARLEATLSALPDLLFEVDRRGTLYDIRTVSPDRLPLPLTQLIGRSLEALIPPAVAGVILEALERAAQQGRDTGALFALQFPEGPGWFELSVAPKGDPQAEDARFIALARDVTERVQAEQALRLSHQHQRALNTLLRIALEEAPLETQLRQALDELLTLDWIPFIPQGAIFLVAPDDPIQLGISVQRGLSAKAQALCGHLPFGTCLCGRAAATREIIFADSDDPRHELRPADMQPHGHYCVPILSGEQVLGVVTLYLHPEHLPKPEETRFLYAAAQVLAVLIERKRAEMALRESQQQYAALVNSVEGIVWEADVRTGRYTFVSRQAESLFGYPLQEWLTRPTFWSEHIYPDDRARVLDYAQQAVADRRDYSQEYRMLTADGRLLWVRDMVTLVIEDGQAVRLRGLTIDITENKRLEQRLSAVYNLGRELTLLYDEKTIIRRILEIGEHVVQADLFACGLVDEQERVLYHYSLNKDTTKEETFDTIVLPLDDTQGVCAAVVRTGEKIYIPDTTLYPGYISPSEQRIYHTELCVPLKVGAQVLGVLNLESRMVGAFDAADEQLIQTLANQMAVALTNARFYARIQRSNREIAALNAAMHALASNLEIEVVLQQTLREIHTLLEARDASIWLLNPEKSALVFAAGAGSTTATALAGQQIPLDHSIASWVIHNRQSALVSHPQEDPRFYKKVDELIGAKTQSLLAVPILVKGEAIGVIEVVDKKQGAFDNHDQELLEALSSSAAVALENARLYQDLQTQFRQLRETQAQLIQSEKMSALGRLTASIAHEINNPLQSIQGCLTLAMEELEEQQRRDRMEKYLQMAESEIRRIAAIVRRVREFYRPAKQEWQPTDIHAILENILELTGKQLQHSAIAVEREWCAEPLLVQANANQLKQVFLNLVLNAIDAMPEGGTLTLSTAQREGQAWIAFRDTGVGMSPQVLEQLFEPFFTTKPHGSGLGLSVSYSIIEAHGGKIKVASEVGVGSTFTVSLPLLKE